MGGIFISHTHSDQALADAVATLVESLFGRDVEVSYSTKKELSGGIGPGDDWFNWIVGQVRDADIALILLTPASIQKPWVLWEAGAVAGAAFATAEEATRVIPLTYGLKPSEIPTPFARTQILSGTAESDANKLIDTLHERFSANPSPGEVRRFVDRQRDAVPKYLEGVGSLLQKLPAVVTEAAVQEWLDRLDQLAAESRFSEVSVIENWLDIAFGREVDVAFGGRVDERQRPLDVRVHRRLGDLYDKAQQPAAAARQFELARQLAPRDLFLLRRLGKAHLDQHNAAEAEVILGAIRDLAADAFTTNVENAALLARWHEQNDNLLAASDVLAEAYDRMPWSYYLGDRLGQLLVRHGDLERARRVYVQVQATLVKLREQNVWTLATGLTAALVCGDEAGVERSLSRLRALRPSRGELGSIERSIGPLLQALGRDAAIVEQLSAMEDRG